ncbi:dynamin family protein [Egicoccus sp. AB-alg2]|uniref:dynamin family protein n=1 Tax=Egicoccus sp. AB-alg2 TaxID=3242693 RepID=UPI00359DD00A
MAVAETPRETVDRILIALAAELAPLAERRLRPHYEGRDDWLQRANARHGKPDRTAAINDPAAVISAILGTWDQVWKPLAKHRSTRSYLHEVRDVRNRWAHNQPLDWGDVRRLNDTAFRILESFGLASGPPPSPPPSELPPGGRPRTIPAMEGTAAGKLDTRPIVETTLQPVHTRAMALRSELAMLRQRVFTAGGAELPQPLAERLDSWSDRLHHVAAAAECVPSVRVTLLGGTGAGKSTLINAVLGERVLASNNSRACTSAAIEVRHGPRYTATVEFVTRRSWEAELERYRDELHTGREEGADGALPPGGEVERKLRSLFGQDAVASFSTSLSLTDLLEPPAVTEALSDGRRTVSASSGDALRRELRRYVTSDGDLWPLVKLVRIAGPFEALAGGGRLVDLPGLNDPNAAREAITRDYLEHSEYVWVVFDMRRALTGDLTDALKEGDLFRRLVMQGREGGLVFVGTHADNIDLSVDADDLELAENISPVDIARARNARCVDTVRAQVRELVADLERASERESVPLQAAVGQLPIFTVSAHNRLVQLKAMRSVHPPVLATPEDTAIPALVRYLQHTAGEGHVHRHAQHLAAQLGAVEAEVLEARAAADSGKALGEFDAFGGQLAIATDDAGRALNAALRQLQGTLRLQLSRARDRFLDELVDGSRRAAKQARTHIAVDLHRFHWSTLRCACRDGGTFLSSTAGRVQLSGEVARPLLDSIALIWPEFFGDQLERIVSAYDTGVQAAVADYGRTLVSVLPAEIRAQRGLIEALADTQRSELLGVLHDAERVAGEIRSRITRTRSDVLEGLELVIDEAMQDGYATAAREYGVGTKARIIDTVSRAGERVLSDVGPQLEKLVVADVDELVEWAAARVADLADEAARRIGGTAERLRVTADERTRAVEAAWQQLLQAVEIEAAA